MFLILLEKLGRKRLLLDRGPAHPEFNQAKPWMNRYYVLFKKKEFYKLDYPAKPRWPLDESAAYLKGAGVKL